MTGQVSKTVQLDIAPTNLEINDLTFIEGTDTLAFGAEAMGVTRLLNISTGEITYDKNFESGSSWWSLASDGKYLMTGTYPSGRIYRSDMKGNGSQELLRLGSINQQDRVVAMTYGAGVFHAGSIPAYGQLGGAVTIFDANGKILKNWRNIVADQSVVGLLHHQGVVYGSTARKGGIGTSISTQPAHVFAYDASSYKLLWSREVAGTNEILSPTIAEDELFYATTAGVLEVDRTTGEVTRKYVLNSDTYDAGYKTVRLTYSSVHKVLLHDGLKALTALGPVNDVRWTVLGTPYYHRPAVHQATGRIFCVFGTTDILELDLQVPQYSPKMTVKGGIGSYYYARGGESVFGKPVANEVVSGEGAYQDFDRNYRIAWTNRNGTFSLKNGVRFKLII